MYKMIIFVYFCFLLILCRYEDDELWAMKIKGSAFLWHQIRCMVAVLFLIGQGLESSNVRDSFHIKPTHLTELLKYLEVNSMINSIIFCAIYQ